MLKTARYCARANRLSSRRLILGYLILSLFLLISFQGCGKKGGGSSAPKNVGGGYTLEVSGGTLNDGTGINGLAILATLRDSSGNGPAMPWTLSITGPDFGAPLTVSYDDGSPSSYMSWWWSGFGPFSGAYTITATNGSTTLTYNLNIDASHNLSQPTLNKSGNTISWNSVTGAGSYQYRVTDGTGTDVISGYIAAEPLLSTYSLQLPSVMSDGSYLVRVFAQTTNRVALQNDSLASPTLASQENSSLSQMDFVVGGTGSGYSLDARGGVLYEGLFSSGTGTPTDQYGLVIWASLLTNASPTTPPAADWTVSLTGPGITTPLKFTYPGTYAQYVYWDFGTMPASGTYTLSAVSTGGTATVQQTFTIPNATSQLPVATGLSATPAIGGGASISWNAVPGAASYYVNLWTCVGAGSANTVSGCTNGGTYSEVAGSWVSTTSAVIPNNTLTPGLVYDVYVTACQQDMTDATTVPPVEPGSQVDMSDTTFTYATFTGR